MHAQTDRWNDNGLLALYRALYVPSDSINAVRAPPKRRLQQSGGRGAGSPAPKGGRSRRGRVVNAAAGRGASWRDAAASGYSVQPPWFATAIERRTPEWGYSTHCLPD